MSDGRNFASDAADPQPAADLPGEPTAALVPAPPPLVVIQYRNRGLQMALLPPLLILLTTLVIMSYQRQPRLRPFARPTTPPKLAGPATPAGRIIMVDGSGIGAAVEPISVRTAIPPSPAPSSDPAPAPTLDPKPGPAPTEARARADTPAEPDPSSPFDLVANAGLQPLPSIPGREIAVEPPLEPPAPLTSAPGERLPADSPELAFRVVTEQAPEPEPKPTKEQILQDIQAESQQKTAERKNFEREIADSKINEFWETYRKVQAERVPFHDDLRRLLRELRDGAGAEINQLCVTYGREAHPEVHKMVVLLLNRSATRLKREAKIEMMRKRGVPEAGILDYLANELDGMRNKRGGPRDRNEVRVRAAQILLTYPPPAVPMAPPTTTSAPRSVAKAAAPPAPRTGRPRQ